jgi:hypothetical protein
MATCRPIGNPTSDEECYLTDGFIADNHQVDRQPGIRRGLLSDRRLYRR